MSAAAASVRDRPEPSGATGPGDGLCHLTCCDPGTAMCGLDVSGYGDVEDDHENCRLCPLCALTDDEGMPCPVPGCKWGRQ